MANLPVVMVLAVCVVRMVSPTFELLHKDKIVQSNPLVESQSSNKEDCAKRCKERSDCISYAYNPDKSVCYLYDKMLHKSDSTDVAEGTETYVTVFDNQNIALKKPTCQSSNWNKWQDSSYGVDGKRDSNFHTGKRGWWCVDLQEEYELKWLFLYNLFDRPYMIDRVKGFEIRLAKNGACTEAGFKSANLCYKDTTSTTQNIYTIGKCSESNTNFDARYIFIYNPQDYLHLYEVEVISRKA